MKEKDYVSIYQQLVGEYFAVLRERKYNIYDKDKVSLDPNILSTESRQKLSELHKLIFPKVKLNVFAAEGCKVVFNGHEDGYFIGANEESNIREHLRQGVEYTVKTAVPMQSFTYVELKELPGMVFNSVRFEEVK